jgi:hypothetical protein
MQQTNLDFFYPAVAYFSYYSVSGEFCDCLLGAVFLKIAEVFPHIMKYEKNFEKKGLGYVHVIFFTISCQHFFLYRWPTINRKRRLC